MRGDCLPKKILKEKEITIAEVKEILEKVDEEELGEFQRRVYEYSKKISSFKSGKVKKLVKKIIDVHKLTISEAIQIVNCMPGSVEEIRSILSVRGRTFQTNTFEEILKELNGFRKK